MLGSHSPVTLCFFIMLMHSTGVYGSSTARVGWGMQSRSVEGQCNQQLHKPQNEYLHGQSALAADAAVSKQPHQQRI